MLKQHFTEQEADAILRKAINRQPLGDEMSRGQLESIASELGITPEVLAAAEIEWREEEREKALRATFAAERRAAFWARLPRALGGYAFLLMFLFMALEDNGVTLFTLILLLFAGFLLVRTAARGVAAYHRGPAEDSLFHEWLAEREQATLYGEVAGETYAAPARGGRMRRRTLRIQRW